MKVLIVEDEKFASNRLTSLIKQYDKSIEVLNVIDSVKSAAQWLMENPAPDLLFFDIQLADGLSFEIFDVVEVKTPVIFTTAYDEYAIKAFKVNSIDYLLKPLDYEDLSKAMKKFRELNREKFQYNLKSVLEDIQLKAGSVAPQYKNRFIVKTGEHLKSILVQEINFIFSRDKGTYMIIDDGKKHLLEQPLDKLEQMLDPANFFRINRQYIITLKSIKDIISYSGSRLKIVLHNSDDNDILVSRERTQDFKQWLDS
jgi:DNA-binding LytR/AlgR family response regulator